MLPISSLSEQELFMHPFNRLAIASVREDIQGLTSQDDKLSSEDKRVFDELSIIEQLYYLADFVLVGLGDVFDNSSLSIYACPAHSSVYVKLTTEQLLRVIIQAARRRKKPRAITGHRARQVLETFIRRPEILPAINRDIIMVSEGLFFDKTKPAGEQLVSSFPSDRRCFFKLFDTAASDKDIIKYPDDTFSASFSKKVRSAYDSLLSILEDLAPNSTDSFPAASLSATCGEEDPLPRHFPFIEQWANGNPGLYWDLLTIPATVFLKEKPSVSFFLSGSSSNGKTSYLGLLHTLLGSNNTTRVKLSDMNKWHLNTQLQYTLFNAPDDEGDSISNEAAEFFKSIASHGTITLPIMRSQKPMQLNADFISAHPMNAFPEWSGTTSSSALTRRTCLIPFTADFRDAPPTSPTGNFARDTFTPDVLAQFTGEVLALASFYSNRPIVWSTTTQEMQRQIKEENESARLYRKEFDKYFDGFQSLGLVYDDYKCWCKAKGNTKIGTQGELKIQFTGFGGSDIRSKARVYRSGKPAVDENGSPLYYTCYKNPDKKTVDKLRKSKGQLKRIAMLDDTTLPPPFDEYGSIAMMHHMDSLDKAVGETSYSAVYLMEQLYGD